jgi:hypothetical protein
MAGTSLAPGARVRSTLEFLHGDFRGWDDDGAALVLWDGQDEVEATFHWDPIRTFVTPVRHRDGRDLGT